jgi:hypothetical protein
MQLAASVDVVPLTRDYIADWERERRTARPSARAKADRAA